MHINQKMQSLTQLLVSKINKKLGAALVEFGYPAPQAPLRDDKFDEAQGDAYKLLVAAGFGGGMGCETWG